MNVFINKYKELDLELKRTKYALQICLIVVAVSDNNGVSVCVYQNTYAYKCPN